MAKVEHFDREPLTPRASRNLSKWRARLRRASWRGVAFYVEEASGEVGRRFQMHEYPQRDQPWAEDLGRSQRRWNVTGYALGPGYMGTRDRLISACEQRGTGTLVHPYLGELRVVCASFRYSERDQEGGICRFQMQFAEPGEAGQPSMQRAAGAALQMVGGKLASAAISRFAGSGAGGGLGGLLGSFL